MISSTYSSASSPKAAATKRRLSTSLQTGLARAAAAVGVTLLTGALCAQQASYTSFGSGCAGTAGVPSLTGVQAPYLGEAFHHQLSNVPANGLALMILGTSSPGNPIPGMPGCSLYASLDSIQVDLASNGGIAEWQTHIPANILLSGQHFYVQGAVFDPTANSLGFVTSGGGDMGLGLRAPMNVTSFAPNTVGPDGIIQIFGNNFPTDPGELCIGATDTVNNARAFLRVDAIDNVAGQQRITAHVVFVDQAFDSGNLMMMVGDNRNPELDDDIHITAPGEQWAWNGMQAPGHAAAIGVLTVVQPDSVISSAQWKLISGEARVTLPLNDPCDGSGVATDWRPGTLITGDLHMNITCPTGTTHWDTFMDQVGVAIGAPGNVIADEHIEQYREVFSAKYGLSISDKVDFGTTVNATTVTMWVRPKVSSGCTITAVGGWEHLNCPDEQECMILRRTGFFQPCDVDRIADNGSAALVTTASLASLFTFTNDIACSVDGETGVTVDTNGMVTFFDVESSTINTTFTDANLISGSVDVTRRGLTAKGTALVAKGPRVRAFDLSTYAPGTTFFFPGMDFTGIAASQHGKYAAVWGGDRLFILELTLTGGMIFRSNFTIAGSTINRVLWNPNFSTAVTAVTSDGKVHDFPITGLGVLGAPTSTVDLRVAAGLVTTGSDEDVAIDISFLPSGAKAYVVYGRPSIFATQQTSVLELTYNGTPTMVSAGTSPLIVWAQRALASTAKSVATTDNGKWMMFATSVGVYGYDILSGALNVSSSWQAAVGHEVLGIVSRKGS